MANIRRSASLRATRTGEEWKLAAAVVEILISRGAALEGTVALRAIRNRDDIVRSEVGGWKRLSFGPAGNKSTQASSGGKLDM